MGASLAHLCVFNYNITKNESYMYHSSMDLAYEHPLIGAHRLQSRELVLKSAKELTSPVKWEADDLIVQIVAVPLVMSPVGYVLKTIDKKAFEEGSETGNPFSQNEIAITIKCTQNDLDDIKIEEFTMTNQKTNEEKKYVTSTFKNVAPDDLDKTSETSDDAPTEETSDEKASPTQI